MEVLMVGAGPRFSVNAGAGPQFTVMASPRAGHLCPHKSFHSDENAAIDARQGGRP
jgi:hypothetical protein